MTHRETTDSDYDLHITIYRDDDCVPKEVCEELNSFDVTEEQKARILHVNSQMKKTQKVKTQQLSDRTQIKDVGEEAVEIQTLNTKKRDRRTIEEIQEMQKRRKN